MSEVPAHEVLGIRARGRGYKTPADVARALQKPPYNIKVGRGYMAGIFNDTRPWPGDELFAALLHLLDLSLEDLDLDPGDRPAVHGAVEWAREHGWPQRRSGGDPGEPVSGEPAEAEANDASFRNRAIAGRKLLIGSGVGACITSSLAGAAAA